MRIAFASLCTCALVGCTPPVDDTLEIDDGASESSEGESVPARGAESEDDSSDESSGEEAGATAECGDGIVDAHESCDDGNELDADGCNVDCRPSGSVSWARVHDGVGRGPDGALGIAALPDGGVVAVGFESASEGFRGAWIRRYDDEGTVVWVDRPVLDPQDIAALDELAAVAIDRDGGIVACGTTSSGTGNDASVVRYDAEGELEVRTSWTSGDPDGFDACTAIATSSDGRIAVTGTSTRREGSDRDLWLGKLNSAGSWLWTTSLGVESAAPEQGEAVGIRADGTIVVAGTTARVGTPVPFAGSWSADGDGPLWSVGGSDDTASTAHDVLLAGAGVIVVGQQWGSPRTRGFWMRGSARGQSELVVHENPAVTTIEAIAIDPVGDVVMVGAIVGPDGTGDLWVEKRDPQWVARWTTTIPGDTPGDELASDVVVADDGVILVAGSLTGAAGSTDAWVLALAP